uniref:Fucosyltransferase 8 n=1 Tax=Ursus americanus TaxID=9643 RepID=A0A452QWQ7_URSAM
MQLAKICTLVAMSPFPPSLSVADSPSILSKCLLFFFNYRIPEGPIDQGPASGRVRALEEQLLKAKEQIENYKKQTRNGLGKDHEILRRRIENGAKELWFFLQSELKKLKNLEGNVLQRHADEFLSDLGHHERSIMTDLYYLSQTDGAGDWREKEAKDLTELVQRRITYLQNPKDCSKAKKLVCNINKGCGYGCQLHHVVYCFMIAYGTQRTLILESQNWRYATGGWETVFRPVSETCTDRSGTSTGHWSGTPLMNLLVITLSLGQLGYTIDTQKIHFGV